MDWAGFWGGLTEFCLAVGWKLVALVGGLLVLWEFMRSWGKRKGS
jgi:hypothetical protein